MRVQVIFIWTFLCYILQILGAGHRSWFFHRQGEPYQIRKQCTHILNCRSYFFSGSNELLWVYYESTCYLTTGFIFTYPSAVSCTKSFFSRNLTRGFKLFSYHFRLLENLPAKLRGKWDMKILFISFCLRINHLSLASNIGTLPF